MQACNVFTLRPFFTLHQVDTYSCASQRSTHPCACTLHTLETTSHVGTRNEKYVQVCHFHALQAAAQAKLDLQTQQEAELKAQQEAELRKQQRLDAELSRQQQQQEAALKQQQEAELRVQQEAKLKRQQQQLQEADRQQQEEQQQARRLKEDQVCGFARLYTVFTCHVHMSFGAWITPHQNLKLVQPWEVCPTSGASDHRH